MHILANSVGQREAAHRARKSSARFGQFSTNAQWGRKGNDGSEQRPISTKWSTHVVPNSDSQV